MSTIIPAAAAVPAKARIGSKMKVARPTFDRPTSRIRLGLFRIQILPLSRFTVAPLGIHRPLPRKGEIWSFGVKSFVVYA